MAQRFTTDQSLAFIVPDSQVAVESGQATITIEPGGGETTDDITNLSDLAPSPGTLTEVLNGIEAALSGKQPLIGSTITVGDGSGSATVAISKSEGGNATLEFRVGPTMRARLRMIGNENLVMSVHDVNAVQLGSITMSSTNGAIILSGAFRPNLQEYADNAAALAAGRAVGDMYRTGPDVKVVI